MCSNVGMDIVTYLADRKPLERRGVILLTVFPVVLFLMMNIAHLALAGFDLFSNQCINMGIGFFLIILALYSYVTAGRIKTAITKVAK